jgi:hypothetical protein
VGALWEPGTNSICDCHFPPLAYLPKQIMHPNRNLAAKNPVTAPFAVNHFRIIQQDAGS